MFRDAFLEKINYSLKYGFTRGVPKVRRLNGYNVYTNPNVIMQRTLIQVFLHHFGKNDPYPWKFSGILLQTGKNATYIR